MTYFCQAGPGHRLPFCKLHQVCRSPNLLTELCGFEGKICRNTITNKGQKQSKNFKIKKSNDLQEHNHKGQKQNKQTDKLKDLTICRNTITKAGVKQGQSIMPVVIDCSKISQARKNYFNLVQSKGKSKGKSKDKSKVVIDCSKISQASPSLTG